MFLAGNAYELDNTNEQGEIDILGYDLKDLKVSYDNSLMYEAYSQLDDLRGEYTSIADTPGYTSKYVLVFKDNSKMWFRDDGQLMMHEDKTGLNEIWYFYEEGTAVNPVNRLRVVVDTAGRKIEFTYSDRDCL
jgi:hypothetical protein